MGSPEYATVAQFKYKNNPQFIKSFYQPVPNEMRSTGTGPEPIQNKMEYYIIVTLFIWACYIIFLRLLLQYLKPRILKRINLHKKRAKKKSKAVV